MAAREQGRSVTATHHRHRPHDGRNAESIALDLADGRAVRRLIDRLRPTAVVNAAYVQRGDELDAVTARAPGTIAAAAAEHGARFVHISSDVVFAGTTSEPLAEAEPVAPITDYGRAKAAAEVAVAVANADATIVRTSLLWSGAPDGPQERLVADPAVTFFTNQVRCPLRVDRLAAAVLELVDRPEITGVLHAGGAAALDRLTFARLLAPLLGIDPSTLRGTVDTSGTRPNEIVLDSSLARSLLASPLPGVRDDTS
jgi:dTDP-4-dehydrorhamnose reductase